MQSRLLPGPVPQAPGGCARQSARGVTQPEISHRPQGLNAKPTRALRLQLPQPTLPREPQRARVQIGAHTLSLVRRGAQVGFPLKARRDLPEELGRLSAWLPPRRPGCSSRLPWGSCDKGVRSDTATTRSDCVSLGAANGRRGTASGIGDPPSAPQGHGQDPQPVGPAVQTDAEFAMLAGGRVLPRAKAPAVRSHRAHSSGPGAPVGVGVG